jgi:glutaredoxin domain-containing cysteine-rich protein 1
MILKGFRVAVDEKDISMDSSYRKELQNALGEHVGNAEEIKLLNESGELENLLKDFPVKDSWLVCESCGDARFVPCSNCNGSRKVFEEEEEELRRCIHCNENGLIRCPACCS